MSRRSFGFLVAFALVGLALVGLAASARAAGIGAGSARGGSAEHSSMQNKLSGPAPLSTPCVPWQQIASPNLDLVDNSLYAVSAVSATDIWAVGSHTTEDFYLRTLIEHWDGTAWTIVPSPDPGTANDLLYGVAAISSSDAWAVGWKTSTNIQQPLFLHWDGTSWSEEEQTFTRPRVTLSAISAVAPNDIWAVGQSCDIALCQRHITAAVHYDGTSWTVVDSPNPGTWDANFNGVVARAANDVWAVGESCTDNGCPTSQSLIEHWDGTAWSVVNSPSPGSARTLLLGVDALTASDAWAVGLSCADAGCASAQSVAQHWDGSSWTTASTPNPGSEDTHLDAVVMLASNDVWASGSDTNDGNIYQNPVIHWDGTSWSVVGAPNPGNSDNELFGLAAVSANDVWAAGNYLDDGATYQTEVLHYTGPCQSGTPTVTPSNTPAITSTSTATLTPTTIPSATPCTINFSDVHTTDYFYEAVTYLFCHGAISGYSDGTFRPFNTTTRGQVSKIVVLGEHWAIDTTGGPHFSDVPESNAFYAYIETAYHHGVISGYADGTFRWGNNVTRAQFTKIVVNAQGWTIDTRGGPTFTDVPPTDPFYGYIQTAYLHGIIGGYSDGTFRPGNPATRGQISNILWNALRNP